MTCAHQRSAIAGERAMGHSSPFVSSCSRRQWARRRSSRSRRSWIWVPLRFGITALVVAVSAVAVVAGRGGF